jgi:hypothetical protein
MFFQLLGKINCGHITPKHRQNTAAYIFQRDGGNCRRQCSTDTQSHGMFLTMRGPRILVTESGSFCQILMANSNFGFFVFNSGNNAPSGNRYCQFSWIGLAPHCSLNLYVPSPGVERPKSNFLKPLFKAYCKAVQYRRLFGQKGLYSRMEDAQGISTVSLNQVIIPAAAGFPS